MSTILCTSFFIIPLAATLFGIVDNPPAAAPANKAAGAVPPDTAVTAAPTPAPTRAVPTLATAEGTN